MLILPSDASDDQIRAAARHWVELFADGRTDEAASLLAYDPGTPDWSPERIRSKIAEFKSPLACFNETAPRITACLTAKPAHQFDDPILDQVPHLVAHWIPSPATTMKYPGRIGEVFYCLPINGYWSDGAVVFQIMEVAGGLALEMHDFLLGDS